MKVSNLVSALRSSTKATLIACSVFLTLTALILFVLMMFPVKIKEQQTSMSANVQIATTTSTSTTVAAPAVMDTETTRETAHTLSTWAVSIDTMTTTSTSATETLSEEESTTESGEGIAPENSEESTVYEEDDNMIHDENGSTYRPDSDWLQENYGYTTPEQTVTETVTTTSELVFDADGEEIVAADPIAPDVS